ncbi:hypothetical protein [Celeribacter naphthalenivorans]|uniref:hypothetical protein n=1 Tax=Celeribacter naphthalenivorans TaxID=1614694 RepID=UPI001CF94EBA|nr:hypothetical protein [Celeribacter naphthalenivorans]
MDKAHVISFDDLRAVHGVHFESGPDLLRLMVQLRRASLTYSGGEAFGLVAWASVLTHDGSRFLRWRWSDAVRAAYASPDGWAVMRREALAKLPGRYGTRLYALAALHRSQKQQQSVIMLDDLRAILGVPDETLPTSGALIAALHRTLRQVNKAARLSLSARTIERDRFATSVVVNLVGHRPRRKSIG